MTDDPTMSQVDDNPTQAVTDSTQQATPSAAEEPSGRSVEGLESEIKRLRSEAARYRTENKALSEKAKAYDEIKRGELSELEKAQARLSELEKAHEEALGKARLAMARAKAAELGFVDSRDVKLLDELPDDESALESALKDLLKAKPYLAKEKGSGIPATERGGNPPASADRAAAGAKEREIFERNPYLARRASQLNKG